MDLLKFRMNSTSLKDKTRPAILLGIVFLVLASPGAAQNIHGISPERAAGNPAIAILFENRLGSAPQQIVGDDFVRGEVIARFPLEMSDEEVEDLAKDVGALRVRRISSLGLFIVEAPPAAPPGVPSTQNLINRLWETQIPVIVEPNYIGGELTFVPLPPLAS